MDSSILVPFLNVLELIEFGFVLFTTVSLIVCKCRKHLEDTALPSLLGQSDFLMIIVIISTLLMRYGFMTNDSSLMITMGITWIIEAYDLFKLFLAYN